VEVETGRVEATEVVIKEVMVEEPETMTDVSTLITLVTDPEMTEFKAVFASVVMMVDTIDDEPVLMVETISETTEFGISVVYVVVMGIEPVPVEVMVSVTAPPIGRTVDMASLDMAPEVLVV